MSELFDDFNKILKKDLVPIMVKYLKDPNNKISDNLSNLLKDSQLFLTDIFEKFSINNDVNNDPIDYTDFEDKTDLNTAVNEDYDVLYKRLAVIEENMTLIANLIEDNN